MPPSLSAPNRSRLTSHNRPRVSYLIFGRFLVDDKLRHGDSALTRRTRLQPRDPCLEIRQALDVDAGPLMDAHPAPVGDIRDAVFVAQILAALELTLEHFAQTAAFVVIALDGHRNFLREISIKDARLAHHRTDA